MAVEGHDDLTQAGASKEDVNKTMAEFLANIESQEPDWEEDLTHRNESDEDIEVSDEGGQFEISSDEEFEEDEEEDRKKKGTAENPITL